MADKDSDYSDNAREFLDKEIPHHMKKHDMSRDQAVAAAMSEARDKGLKVPSEEESDSS